MAPDKNRTCVAAFGYAILYAAMLMMLYSVVAPPKIGAAFMLIQPAVIIAVLYGIHLITADRRTAVPWMVSYFCVVLGLLTVASAVC
jgi:fatty-acid desaturase